MSSRDELRVSSSPDVPRQIWVLWTQGLDQMPPVPRACIDSWQQLNPGWDIRALTAESLGEWVDPVLCEPQARALAPNRLSNLVRLSLLARHGGVWVDATCYCMKPLDEWLPDYLGSGFFAFARPARDRLMSNWFLASLPDGHIPRRMLDALSRHYLDPNLSEDRWHRYACRALDTLLNHDARTTSLWFAPPLSRLGLTPYYYFHYTFNRLTRTDPAFAEVWEQTPKVSADGPHSLQFHGLDRPPSPQIRAEIEQRRVPMYKLDWRIDPQVLSASSTLNVLLGPTAPSMTPS